MIRTIYSPPPVDYKSKPVKSQTKPDDSMSIKELVRRFLKGIPADVIQRQPVYDSESSFDLEKLALLEPADRAFMADEMKRLNEANRAELERMYDEAQARKKERGEAKDAEESAQSGIEDLDNTMPDDTNLKNSKLGIVKSKNKA